MLVRMKRPRPQEPKYNFRFLSVRVDKAKPVLFVVMFDETKELSLATGLLKNSARCREFQAEPEENLKDKWIESEKAGRDLGFERALADWIMKHRSNWRKSRQPENQLKRLSTP